MALEFEGHDGPSEKGGFAFSGNTYDKGTYLDFKERKEHRNSSGGR